MDIELFKFLANYGSLGIFAFIFFRYIDRTVKKQDQMTQRLFDKQDETTNNLVELMTLLKENLINSRFTNRQLKQVLYYKYSNIAYELENKMSNYIFKNNIAKNYDVIHSEILSTSEHIKRNYTIELAPLIEETKFNTLKQDLEDEINESIHNILKVFEELKTKTEHTIDELESASRKISSNCKAFKNNLLKSSKKVC